MNIDIKEQIDNDNNINQVEITAHDINSDDKTKIGEKIDMKEYTSKINNIIDDFNTKKHDKEYTNTELIVIGKEIQSNSTDDTNDEQTKTIKSIEDMLFQLHQGNDHIESLLDPEIMTKRMQRAIEAYTTFFEKDIENMNGWGINKEEMIKNFKEYFIPTEEIIKDYTTNINSEILEKKPFQIICKLFEGTPGRGSGGVDKQTDGSEVLSIDLFGLSHDKEEFQNTMKGTLFHEFIHLCQHGNKEKNNNQDDFKTREYRKNLGIENPSREIMFQVAGMFTEAGAVSLTGALEGINDLQYNQGSVIITNYLFLYSKNGVSLQNKYMNFNINGRTMPQAEIDNLAIDFYKAIEEDKAISSILGVGEEIKRTRGQEMMKIPELIHLIEKICANEEKKDLTFFKSCCARPGIKDSELKDILIDAIQNPPKRWKSPIQKENTGPSLSQATKPM